MNLPGFIILHSETIKKPQNVLVFMENNEIFHNFALYESPSLILLNPQMMKKIFVILTFMLMTFTAIAQEEHEYEPFIVDGKVWYYDYVTYVGTTQKSYTYKMYFSGDTVIGGKDCKYLIEEFPNTPLFVTGTCYEEDGKVWMIYRRFSNSPQPRLLFDFSCHEGDTLTNLYCWGDDSFKVQSVETVSSFGRERRLVALSSVKYPQKSVGYWLEGVGSRYEMFDIWPSFAASVKFLYCELNGERIADQSSFGDASLETLDIHQTTTRDKDDDSEIFDLTGRRLNGVPSHGVYIRNGRKYVKY